MNERQLFQAPHHLNLCIYTNNRNGVKFLQQLYQQLTAFLLSDQQHFYRTAYSYCHNPEAALDIVQNAACKALEKYQTLREPAYMKTWFYRILINESLTYLRQNKKELPEDAMPDDTGHDPLSNQANYLDLYDAILQLPAEIKTIVLLHYFEDMTLRQIAQVTQVNENTVKSRLYSGLKKLRLSLKEESL